MFHVQTSQAPKHAPAILYNPNAVALTLLVTSKGHVTVLLLILAAPVTAALILAVMCAGIVHHLKPVLRPHPALALVPILAVQVTAVLILAGIRAVLVHHLIPVLLPHPAPVVVLPLTALL